MRSQVFVVPVTIVAALGIVTWVTSAVSGQSASTPLTDRSRSVYTAPPTPEGHPDLQGYWTNSTSTPLQRPNNVTKEYYTLEEVLAAEKRSRERENSSPNPHYSATEFGLDRSQGAYSRNLRTSLIVDPPDGRLPPLSPEGEKRAAAFAEERRRMGDRFDAAENNELDDRCISSVNAGPPMLVYPYNSNYQILQTRDHVLILAEMMHHARIIPLGDTPKMPATVRQLTGVSRGRWEGDTLVVETTNIDRTKAFGGIDLDSPLDRPNPFRGIGDNVRVTERFRRTDAETIMYTFTVEDPTTWTRPWTAELPLKSMEGPLWEHACHEGNYGLTNTLEAARMEDKAKMGAGSSGQRSR